MAEMDHEFPIREEFPPLREEFLLPEPEAEYRPSDPSSEFTPPPGTDYANPAEELEFTPPGTGARQAAETSFRRRRRIRKLLYAAAALVLTGLLFSKTTERETLPVSAVTAPPEAPVYTSGSDIPLPEPTPEPTPVSRIPQLELVFFYFSHEHHGSVLMSNTDALHSVYVSVRETVLDKQVYEHTLSDEEIESGRFDLPMLSTGDYYMENMDALDPVRAWPKFELSMTAWYENETGDGEDTLTLTAEAEFEMGMGLSYMRPDQTWSEVIAPDSFYVVPWAETDEIRYVINDPDAVTDPTVFSVDLSWNGRHAAPEEYQEVIEKSEYTLIDPDTGEGTPTVSYTKELVLHRPDWMPEQGVLHVHIVQRLASTGELWVRDYDYDYSQRSDFVY